MGSDVGKGNGCTPGVGMGDAGDPCDALSTLERRERVSYVTPLVLYFTSGDNGRRAMASRRNFWWNIG